MSGPGRQRRRPRGELRLPLLALLVVGSVLALGSQHVWAVVTLGLVATLLLALSLDDLGRPPRLAWLLAGLIVYTLLQLVPLPFAAVTRLSPAAAELWAMAAKVLNEPIPRFVSLSVDPQATALEALKWWIYLATFLSAVALRRWRGSTVLASVLFVSAGLLALITLLHGLFDWQRVYGLYQPSFATERWQRGPLLNSNNLAAYLNLGLGVTAGLLASGRTSLPRWLLLGGALVMAALVLLSGSRGGLLVMLLLGVAFCAALVWSSGLDGKVRRLTLGAVALGLVAVATALALAGDRLLRDWLGQDSTRKLAAWRWTADLIQDYPWFGVGRGAYETAFPMYRGYLGYDWTSVFAYPENLVLQWLSEWGVVIGGVGLLAFAAHFVLLLRRSTRARLTMGVGLGCCALLLQNAADLSSELCGVMLALVVGLGALDGATESRVARSDPNFRRVLLVGLVGAALVGLGVTLGRHPAREDRVSLAEAYRVLGAADGAARARFRGALGAAMLRHPGDPYLPLLGGLLAQGGGEPNALAWLGHALTLGPTTGTVHLALADVLAARGARGQAHLHLRLASQYDATLRGAAVRRAARWARDADELERAFPAGSAGALQLTQACPQLAAAAHAIECWRRVARRSQDLAALEELAEKLAAAVRESRAPCAGVEAKGCRDEVIALAIKGHGSWRIQAAHAELAAAGAERQQATRELIEHCPGGLGGTPCLRRALGLARAARDTAVLQRAIERFLAVACSGDVECADAHDVAAAEYAGLNALALALKHRQEAARAWPSATRWLAVADAALRATAFPTAEVALRRVEGFSALSEAERAELSRIRHELAAGAQPD